MNIKASLQWQLICDSTNGRLIDILLAHVATRPDMIAHMPSNDLKDTQVWLLCLKSMWIVSNLKSYCLLCTNAISLCPFRRVALVMCVVVMQPSSALALLNLSTPSLCLTGEASHMDWQRDWEILSQPCGDQGEGKRHTNTNRPPCGVRCPYPLIQSSLTYLVFMTHPSQVDYRCAHHLLETLTAMQDNNNKLWCA